MKYMNLEDDKNVKLEDGISLDILGCPAEKDGKCLEKNGFSCDCCASEALLDL